MSLEVTIKRNSKALTSTKAFQEMVGQPLCSSDKLSFDEWRGALFLTREKLMRFETVTLATDNDGDIIFKHGEKRARQSKPTSMTPDEIKEYNSLERKALAGLIRRRKNFS